MLDPIVRPFIDPLLGRVGKSLAARGASADGITLLGLILGLAAAALIAAGAFMVAIVPLLLGRVADGLDGAVARVTRRTDWGGYWDITADYIFYAAIPLAFVAHDPARNGLAGAFLLASFTINASSFLGFAIVAERRRLATEERGKKSFFHSGGTLEGTETIIFFILICLFPAAFQPLAVIFGVLCIGTGTARLVRARGIFRDDFPARNGP